eukprot:882043-Amphidinium_carterae.1
MSLVSSFLIARGFALGGSCLARVACAAATAHALLYAAPIVIVSCLQEELAPEQPCPPLVKKGEQGDTLSIPPCAFQRQIMRRGA